MLKKSFSEQKSVNTWWRSLVSPCMSWIMKSQNLSYY